ncbi:MAG: DUF2975 domain-containing protein [Acidimicrobiia bacterium]
MRGRGLVTVTRWLIGVFMVIEVIIIAGFVLGASGLGLNLPDFGGRLLWEGQEVMSAEGLLRVPPAVDIDLSTETTSEGTRDASTGLPPAELTGPFTARVSIWGPTALERILFVIARIAIPLVALGVLWLLFGLVSSVKRGNPFTAENSRRLWLLALVVGIGGTVANAYAGWLDSWLISRSAAAPAFLNQGFVSFAPLLIGLLIAVLAVAWTRGVILEEDTEGLV